MAITTVGIEKFVLCAAAPARGGAPGAPVLRVAIPPSALALRACEVGEAGSGALTLTCYPVAGAGTRSFSVTIPGTPAPDEAPVAA